MTIGYLSDMPCAAPGLISYRYKGRYGFVMIGARGDADALREAARSSGDVNPSNLEIWDGKKYIPTSSVTAGQP